MARLLGFEHGRYKHFTRNWACTKARQVRRFLLAVYHFHSLLAQVLYEVQKCHFGSIANAGKHRFAVKHLAKADAISSTDQLPIEPSFDAMGVA